MRASTALRNKAIAEGKPYNYYTSDGRAGTTPSNYLSILSEIDPIAAIDLSSDSNPLAPIGTSISQNTIINQTNQTGGNTMPTAGQDLSVYEKIDSFFGGYLPGGIDAGSSEINPLLGSAVKIAGGTALAATAVTGGIWAYNKFFKKDGTTRKIKANGQPYKKPSMNYANGRALNRAERRLTSFKKHYAKHVRALGFHVSRIGGK